jgi:predicted small lipoprotein YifL
MRCWPGFLLWFVITLLAGSSLLSACGQKGDLYLPDDTEEKKQQNS